MTKCPVKSHRVANAGVTCGRAIRAYLSVEDRERSQDAFYGSDEWRRGPRQAIVDCIESDTSMVIEMDPDTIDLLRR